MAGQFLFLFLLILAFFLCASGCVNREAANRHLNFGLAYIEAGQYPQALNELLEAEKNNPKDAQIHYFLGVCYFNRGMSKETIEELEKAISLRENYSEAHNQLGSIYAEMGRFDDAINEFKKALSNLVYVTPSYAMNNLAWAYYKKGDYAQAMSKYEELLKREPTTPILPLVEKNMGVVTFSQKRYDTAAEHLRKSLTIAPNFTEARLWLGKALAAQGKYKEAEQEFNNLIEAMPGTPFAAEVAAELKQLRERADKTQAAAKLPVAKAETEDTGNAVISGPSVLPREVPPFVPDASKPVAHKAAEQPPAVPVKPEASGSEPEPEPEPAGPATKPLMHAVEKGETLFSIASKYGVSSREIALENGFSTRYKVKKGDMIIIPEKNSNQTKTKSNRIINYHVQLGDSLATIAKRFNTSVEEIRKLNGLKSNRILYGQVLKIEQDK